MHDLPNSEHNPSHMLHSQLSIASGISHPLYLHLRCRAYRDSQTVCLSTRNTALSGRDLAQCILRLVIFPVQVLAAVVRDRL